MARGRRTSTSGAFRIGGIEGRWPTVGAAINVASRRAEQAPDEVQMGVYEGDRQAYRVTREADGSVTIREVAR